MVNYLFLLILLSIIRFMVFHLNLAIITPTPSSPDRLKRFHPLQIILSLKLPHHTLNILQSLNLMVEDPKCATCTTDDQGVHVLPSPAVEIFLGKVRLPDLAGEASALLLLQVNPDNAHGVVELLQVDNDDEQGEHHQQPHHSALVRQLV